MLRPMNSIARSVEAFKVAFELPSVGEDDLNRLGRAEIFTNCEFHSLVCVFITEPGLELLSMARDLEARHRIDSGSTASVVLRYSTVTADILMNLQCSLMSEVWVTTSQLGGFMLGGSSTP